MWPFDPDLTAALALLAAVGAVGSALLAFLSGRSQARGAPPTAEQLTTERRLEHLAETLSESSKAMRQVETEIQVRREAMEVLKKEADKAQRVALLNADARDAVQQLFRDELAVASRRNSRASLRINVFVFIAGVLASVAIQLLVHPL